jgi:NAD-dependent dihydropyrimidine dehydrogenase PreA subunit/flavodoxin
MYFSPTDTTKKTVERIAEVLADKLNCEKASVDFTLPQVRERVQTFEKGDLVVFGTPVYAGRVPNVLLKYIHTVQGGGALAVPVVLFGNRNYDDALAELQALLGEDGFLPVAAGAFVGEHSFSRILGAGRPDEKDMAVMDTFALDIYEKLVREGEPERFLPISVGGEYPSKGYYQPRDRQGNPVDIRKVQPKTSEKCDDCKLCAKVCPMGSISAEDVRVFTGICIKCGSCIKKCPVGAKYYDAESYLYHQHELEEEYTRRAEPSVFL